MADFDIDILIDDEIDIDVEFENLLIQGSVGNPVTVENSDDTYSQQQACGTKHELPDVNNIDGFGNVQPTPGQTVFVCETLQELIDDSTAAQVSAALEANDDADKIAYRRPALTGQTAIHRVGDDGWRLQNGIYQYDQQGKRPILQGEDSDNADGTLNDWFLLSPKTPNAFGTLFRFTDENGDRFEDTNSDGIPDAKNVAAAYTNNYMINHLSGVAYSIAGIGTTASWNAQIDAALAFSVLGFSDFYLANVTEGDEILCYGLTPTLSYLPIGLSSDVTIWTGTTVPSDALRAFQAVSQNGLNDGGNIQGAKTALKGKLFVRNHYT